MGTSYYFHCTSCDKISNGSIDKQAHGTHVDVVECFRFILKHMASCGHKSIIISCENNLDYGDPPRDVDIKKLHRYFPFSQDFREDKIEEYKKEYEEAIKEND